MLPSLSLPFRQPRCIPKVILLSISVWKVATFAEASKCRDCVSGLDGNVCVVKCSGNFSTIDPPLLHINGTSLNYEDTCRTDSSEDRAYCKFQTSSTAGVKIREYGTFTFRCDPNRRDTDVRDICRLRIIYNESTCSIEKDPTSDSLECIKGKDHPTPGTKNGC
jgi:hypothetical protein